MIRFTNHAMKKMKERSIDRATVESAIEAPLRKESDKTFPEIVHFICEKEGKYLRAIGKFVEGETFLVVSAFYDRRLKKREAKNAQH